MSEVLIVTWFGGGATRNALRIARELAERGHQVRVLTPERFSDMIRDLGCEPIPHPEQAEFDPTFGRAIDDQPAFMRETFFGPHLAAAVRAAATERRPDVIVVDYLLRSATVQAEALGLRTVSLMHMASYRQQTTGGDPDAEWGWRWQYDQVNNCRVATGLTPLAPTAAIPATLAQACRSHRVLVTLPRELDSWTSPPDNVVYVGAINESRTPTAWHSPWPPTDDRPLFVVTFGTTYMHQEDLMERVLDTVAAMSARVLVLTGDDLDPVELPAPPGIRVERYVPHQSVFPHAHLVLTHGGMGTLLECLRAGVPSICFPLGRDQHDNTRAAAALNATIALERTATTTQIEAAIDQALHSAAIRDGVATMAQHLSHYDGATTAANEIERVCE